MREQRTEKYYEKKDKNIRKERAKMLKNIRKEWKYCERKSEKFSKIIPNGRKRTNELETDLNVECIVCCP